MNETCPTTYTWSIIDVIDEAPRVRSLILKARDTRPDFISGQYLTVLLSGYEPAEGKSYSISSSGDELLVRLTIKEMGAFSKALYAHNKGDTLTTSAPYGFFYPEQTSNHDLVFIAGGIGITPNISIIKKLCSGEYPKKITLFYSNKTIADIIFKEELDVLQKKYPLFNVIHHITQEEDAPPPFVKGRMTGVSILKNISDIQKTELFICGSIDFTKNLWRELREEGIPNTQLYTEGFF
ncbi:MAG: hypothetical protein K9M10_03700 [Candidatus Pacebacteria bacterium]|nr:hypothetical protein [Candidatus Paceibacterota bacterium]MCF7857556.1 hypothetical protein [Candidatus Paceibacterota bacterium]